MYSLKIAMAITIFFSLSHPTMASNQDEHLILIEPNLFAHLTFFEPPYEWRISHVHSYHLLFSAYYPQRLNYEKALTPDREKTIGNKIAAPEKLVEFINERLPLRTKYRARANLSNSLLAIELINHVKNSIDQNFPLMVYVKDHGQIGLATILGYHVSNTNNIMLLVLSGQTTGRKKLEGLSLNKMIERMDLEQVIQEIQFTISNLDDFTKRNSALHASDTQDYATQFISQIGRFNIIEMQKRESQSYFHVFLY